MLKKDIYVISNKLIGTPIEQVLKKTSKRYKVGSFPLIKLKMKERYIDKNGIVRDKITKQKQLCYVVGETKDAYYINIIGYGEFMNITKQTLKEIKETHNE